MSSPDRFLARPGQSLSDHLDGVVDKATTFVPSHRTTSDGESFQDLVATIAHLHDIGKLTPWFQEYIRERPDRRPTEEETHAAVGAILTFHALGAQGFDTQSATAGFYAVLKHHGVIPNIREAHSAWTRKETRYPLLQKKFEAIDETARTAADSRLTAASNGTLSWADIPITQPQAYKPELGQFTVTPEFYPVLLQAWSTLTCADKFDAAGIPIESRITRPDPSLIAFDTDATGLERRLNRLRTQARRDVVDRLEAQPSEGGVYTLTLPTGFGKTFAGLEAALRKARDQDGRVVYALPYTSVLDQVHGEIMAQFGVDPQGDRYTLHHHLADTRTRIDDRNERVTASTEALYGESWRSGLILTTFVQLFESLAGPGNTQSMKLPALQDATLIVDEPQILTPEWWQLVARVTTVLVEKYDAAVILMTATQPRFIEASDFEIEPMELVPDPATYFDFLADNERVRFHFDSSLPVHAGHDDPRPIADAAEQIVDRTLTAGGTTLAVNNTVAATSRLGSAVTEAIEHRSRPVISLGAQLDAYLEEHGESIREAALDDTEMQTVVADFLRTVDQNRTQGSAPILVVTLTAALRPCERAVLIATIRALLDSSSTPLDELPLVVSSTQLVEAGVDISVDRVYRDFAPLPSVVQAAGRCNRSFGGEAGRVVLWRLRNRELDRVPASIVYARERDRLQPTITALQRSLDAGQTSLPEAQMVTTAVEAYYDALHTIDHRSSEADRLVQAYNEAQGEHLRSESMIEDPMHDILVLRTDADIDILRQYLAARESEDYQQAQSIRQELKHLLTSVADERLEQLPPTDQLVTELAFEDTTVEEFAILDDREGHRYDLATGKGLRVPDGSATPP